MASALPVDCAMKTLSLEADDGVIQAEHVVGCESSSGSSSPTTSEASEDSLERVRFSRCSVRDSTVSEDDDELEKNDTNAEDVLTIPRTAHEVLYAELEPPSIPDATLVRPEYQLHRLGTLVAFVDDLVVVESAPSVCAGVVGSLGEGSLLCFADRQPLGFVFEIFGAVQRPLYVVRIHPQDEAVRGSLQTGCDVFYVDELRQPLRLESSSKRGCDACNEFGEEADESDLEFSDDEEEAKAQRRARQRRSTVPLIRDAARGAGPSRGSRAPQQRVSSSPKTPLAATPKPFLNTRPARALNRRQRGAIRQRAPAEQRNGRRKQGPNSGSGTPLPSKHAPESAQE